MRIGLYATTLLGLAFLAGSASAGITITQDANVGAGMSAFGPSATILDWSAGGAPGSLSGAINIDHWIDGVGFDGSSGPAVDLAINGVEDVTWTFAGPVRRIGFAISTGLGRRSSEIDHLGASFTLQTDNGDMGTLNLIDPGPGYAAWVVVSSSTAFSKLSFTENTRDISDQYWGNVVAAIVPEPQTWALMIAGFGVAGAAMRRRKARIACAAQKLGPVRAPG